MSHWTQPKSFLNVKRYAVVLMAIALLVGLGVPSQAFHFPWDQGHDTTDWDDPSDPGPCEGGFCECDTGNCGSQGSPVYLATGHFIWTDTDIVLKGRPPLEISRTYNSNDPRDGFFGNGWSFSHDRVLNKVTQADSQGVEQQLYIWRLANGKRYIYRVETNGSITSPPGVIQTIEPQSDGSDWLVSLDGSYEVYAFGKLTAVVDRNGNTINYEYNTDGTLLRVADTNGRVFDFDFTSSGRIATITDHANRTWKYDYDSNGTLINVTDPLGGVMTYEYQSYQPLGDGNTYYQITSITDPTNVVVTRVTYNGDQVRTYTEGENIFTLSYNASSRTVSKTDSVGSTWRTTYDAAGLFISQTDPLNQTVQYQRDVNGVIIGVVDELGNSFSASYDSMTRLISETDPRGTVTFEYQGNLPWATKVTSRSGRISQLTYDARGNLLTVTDPSNAITQFTWNGNGDLMSTINALNQQTTITSNDKGLPLLATDGLNRTTSFNYDSRGNVISMSNPQGETVQYQYDDLDRLTRESNALGHITQYDYDAASRLTRIVAPNNQQISYIYDNFGRLSQRINYDGTLHSYNYYPDNLISQLTQPAGILTAYIYDLAKRPTQVTVNGEATTFKYSLRGDLIQANNLTGSVNMSYDNFGRLLSETLNGQTIQYVYNIEDELEQLISLGSTQIYKHDNRGLLTEISKATENYNFMYDALGRRTRLTQPNGNEASYQYSVAGKINQIKHEGIFNATYQYQYDNANRIIGWTGDGQPKTYQYDSAGRLIQAVDDFGINNYVYDELGNILGNGRAYDEANRLIQDAVTTYGYDENGNLTLKQDTTTGSRTVYTWNSKSQLLKLELYAAVNSATPLSTTTYTYGPFNRRWSKTTDGITERYMYSGDDRIGVLDGSDNVSESVTFSGVIDEPLGMKKGGGNYFFHQNHQASVMALTDTTGVKASYQYDSYGQTTVGGDGSLSDFGYTGRENDGNGLYFYRARYYDSNMRRFIQSDPIDIAGGLNTYAYVGNNPVNLIDPTGECPWCLGAVFGAGVDIAIQLAMNGGNWKCIDVGQVALSAALGAVGGGFGSAAGKQGLTSAARGLSNSAKGRVGEGLSTIKNLARGSRRVGTQVRVPGQTTIADSAWVGRDGTRYYVESKFGTSGLTRAQRAAQQTLGDSYRVEKWTYPWIGDVGANVGAAAGGAGAGAGVGGAAGSNCGCE